VDHDPKIRKRKLEVNEAPAENEVLKASKSEVSPVKRPRSKDRTGEHAYDISAKEEPRQTEGRLARKKHRVGLSPLTSIQSDTSDKPQIMVKPVTTRMRGKDGMVVTIRPKPMKRLLAKREKKPELQDIVPSFDREGQQQKQVRRPPRSNEVGHVSISCVIVSLILVCSLTSNQSQRYILNNLNRRCFLLLFRHCVVLSIFSCLCRRLKRRRKHPGNVLLSSCKLDCRRVRQTSALCKYLNRQTLYSLKSTCICGR